MRRCSTRQHALRLRRFGEMIVAGEIVDEAIVLVDVLAGADRYFGEADDLAELADRLALGDRRRRHLVTLRHSADRGDALGDCAGHDRVDRDDDVVGGVEPQNPRVAGALGQVRAWVVRCRSAGS